MTARGTELRCTRCGYVWPQRLDEPPQKCPQCASFYYDIPPKFGAKEKVQP